MGQGEVADEQVHGTVCEHPLEMVDSEQQTSGPGGADDDVRAAHLSIKMLKVDTTASDGFGEAVHRRRGAAHDRHLGALRCRDGGGQRGHGT